MSESEHADVTVSYHTRSAHQAAFKKKGFLTETGPRQSATPAIAHTLLWTTELTLEHTCSQPSRGSPIAETSRSISQASSSCCAATLGNRDNKRNRKRDGDVSMHRNLWNCPPTAPSPPAASFHTPPRGRPLVGSRVSSASKIRSALSSNWTTCVHCR